MLGPRTGRENIHTLVRPRCALAKQGGVSGTSMGAALPPWVPAPPRWAPTSLLWVLALGTTTWGGGRPPKPPDHVLLRWNWPHPGPCPPPPRGPKPPRGGRGGGRGGPPKPLGCALSCWSWPFPCPQPQLSRGPKTRGPRHSGHRALPGGGLGGRALRCWRQAAKYHWR